MRSHALSFSALAGALLATIALALPCAAATEPGVTRALLDNGLRVVIVRDPLAPVVTTEVNYLAGSIDSPPGFPGMAHAQEHMMFRGSPTLSADQIAAITAAMGGDFDADTQPTITQFFLTVPAEDLGVALHLEAARMQGVNDAQDQWDEERGPIEQEVAADESDPVRKMLTTINADLYAGTPYAIDGVGTRPSFDQTTGSMIHDFYQHWYAPNDAILIVAGDIDPASTLTQVRELFGSIPARTLPPRPSINLAPLTAALITSDTDLPVPIAVVAYRMPPSDSTDFAAGQVLAGALASQRANLYALVPQ
ncbi:MAG TPA: pitrilysin family protein, partial [Candidatus Eremiobacteraceae bacterium]|nr:pitrilysin family protein [Candidatus Eremiobacteraceae bacterium]